MKSTLACSIVAKKLYNPTAHVEAGLRSGDMRMPVEINRLVTDSISKWFFVSEPSGAEHLRREGEAESAIHYVGHVMVDNVLFQGDKLVRAPGEFETSTFKRIAEDLPLIFPVHPRARGNLEKLGIDLGPNITLVAPQGYMAFLDLWKDAVVVLTDSGGMQEETTALGVPCITIRENTERPITVDEGTNVLAGTDPERIVADAEKVLRGDCTKGRRPALWDGKAAERIVAILSHELN